MGGFLSSSLAGAVLVPFTLRTLGLSGFGLRLALAIAGIGGLLGSFAATRLGVRWGASRRGLQGLECGGVRDAGTECQPLDGQSVTPDRLQGRMNATMRSINRAMVVIGRRSVVSSRTPRGSGA